MNRGKNVPINPVREFKKALPEEHIVPEYVRLGVEPLLFPQNRQIDPKLFNKKQEFSQEADEEMHDDINDDDVPLPTKAVSRSRRTIPNVGKEDNIPTVVQPQQGQRDLYYLFIKDNFIKSFNNLDELYYEVKSYILKYEELIEEDFVVLKTCRIKFGPVLEE